MGAPGFWDDQATAARTSMEHSRVTRRLERYERLQREYTDADCLLSQCKAKRAPVIAIPKLGVRAEF